MESFGQDVRLAIRLLLKQPGFSLLAIGTLALGIGLSTALFSVLDAAFIRPLPYYDPDRLVDIHVGRMRGDRMSYGSPTLQDVRDWQEHGGVFTHVAYSRNAFTDPQIVDGPEPHRVLAERVSRDFFPMYGVRALHGRLFSDEEYARNADDVVVVGYDFWRTRFGADPAIVGSTIRLNEQPAIIIGVLPRWFYAKTKLWRPFPREDGFLTGRFSGAGVDGRLRPGLTIPEAERQLTALLKNAASIRGGDVSAVRLTSQYESATRGNAKTARVIAYGVGLVLLLACVNVAGLLLARGAVRRPELAVRASIGAGRGRLIRQLLTESLVLALSGAILGVMLAWLALDTLVANVPMFLPSNAPVVIDLKVLAFSVALALATTLFVGLIPAWRMSRITAGEALARAGRRQGSGLSHRAGQTLIGAEVAVALVLLTGAGLMIRSFAKVLSVDVGFDPGAVIAMEVAPATPGRAAQTAYYPELLEHLRARPGVSTAGAVDYPPVIGGGSRFTAARVPGGRPSGVGIRQYLGDFFSAIGARLKDGRFPTDSDHSRAVKYAVINESAANAFFGGERAVGRQIEVGLTPSTRRTYEIAAVVDDFRHSGPLSKPEPEVWYPFDAQDAHAKELTIIVRPAASGGIRPADVRRAAFIPGRPVIVEKVAWGTTWLHEDVVTPRRRTVLLGLLGALGFLLALVGTFGMTAYAVTRRTREIGVRMTFGASTRDVVGRMLRDSVVPVAFGIAAGLVASWWATRVIQSFLFETEPRDVATFAAVALVLAAAAIVAAWIPARRAARVDPIIALRSE